MNHIQSIVIAMVRRSLFQPLAEIPSVELYDWQAVYDECRCQGVTAFAYSALSSANLLDQVPESLCAAWKNATRAIGIRHYTLCERLLSVVHLLEAHQIKCTVLKGISAARNYPKPECRQQSDIDLFIGLDNRDTVHDVMTQNGYVVYPLQDHPCHDVYTKDNLLYEMHFEVSGLPDGDRSARLRPYMSEVNAYSRIAECLNGHINVPDVNREAVVLLLHLHHHMMGEGIGLRHICDYFVFVQAQMTETKWIELLEILDGFGMKTFAYTLAVMGVHEFGLNMPYLRVANKEETALAQDLLDDILLSGMFGIKDNERAYTSKLISNHGKTGTDENLIMRSLHIVTQNTYTVFPSSRKNKSLYFVYWIATFIRQAYRLLFGKTVMSKQIVKSAKSRKALYSKLRVFEPEL